MIEYRAPAMSRFLGSSTARGLSGLQFTSEHTAAWSRRSATALPSWLGAWREAPVMADKAFGVVLPPPAYKARPRG